MKFTKEINHTTSDYKTVLITGSFGFVGKNLINYLNQNANKIYILTPSSKELDLTDFNSVDNYYSNNKIDVVIHLAAKVSGIGELTTNPLYYFENNLLINYNLVHLSLKHNVKKFITLGSSCSYSNKTMLPMKEQDLWLYKPENGYGICKLTLLEHLQSQSQMSWCYFIFGNLYGPYDHFEDENAHLIPVLTRKIVNCKNNDTILVWGDGSQKRDFLYVDDAVRVISDAIHNDSYNGFPINVSTNTASSVNDIIQLIVKNFDKSVRIEWDLDKPIGIKKKLLDNSQFLAICPNYNFTSLQDGIEKTIRWYKEQKEYFNYE